MNFKMFNFKFFNFTEVFKNMFTFGDITLFGKNKSSSDTMSKNQDDKRFIPLKLTSLEYDETLQGLNTHDAPWANTLKERMQPSEKRNRKKRFI